MLSKIFSVVFCSLLIVSFSEETIIYNKTTGDKNLKTVWTLKKEKDLLKVESQNTDKTMMMEATLPYKIKKFNMVSHKSSNRYVFTREGSKLLAEGKRKGKELKESYDIGSQNWVQEFELGLRPFLKSKKKTYKFVILNPKNFNLHQMVATKQGSDELSLDGKKFDTVKVKVTLAGFKSVFWKAQLWYDSKDHTMLLYKSNEGPHTPTTTISFVSKEGSSSTWYDSMVDKVKGKDADNKKSSTEADSEDEE